MSDDQDRAELVRFARNRAKTVLQLHIELAPVTEAAAARLQEFGDTKEMAETYRELAASHRRSAERIERSLDEDG